MWKAKVSANCFLSCAVETTVWDRLRVRELTPGCVVLNFLCCENAKYEAPIMSGNITHQEKKPQLFLLFSGNSNNKVVLCVRVQCQI